MRIVSLLPSASEIVARLGLLDQLVGVSHECDHPAEVQGRPVLTSSILAHGLSPAEIDAAVAEASLERRPLYAVDGELLASLKPDLIVTQGVCSVCAVTPETVSSSLSFARLESACAAPVLSLSGIDYAGICADIRAVAEACGAPERAEALVAEMDARWRAIPALPGPAPRVLMLEWPGPPWSAGHWVPEQVAAAGGLSLLSDAGGKSRRLTWEEIAEADPDLLVGAACGYDLDTNLKHLAEGIRTNPHLQQLRAVKTGQVWAADANGFFSRPAPRVVDGAELLAAIFSGGPVDASRAKRLQL